MQLSYHYTHTQTVATTGFFSCEPDAAYTLADLCEALEASPLDSFLHSALLQRLRSKSCQELLQFFSQVYDPETDVFRQPALASVLFECAGHDPSLKELLAAFPTDSVSRLCSLSPLLSLHRPPVKRDASELWWQKLYHENTNWLRSLPSQEEVQKHVLISSEEVAAIEQSLYAPESITDLYARFSGVSSSQADQESSLLQLFREASDRLLEAGLLVGCEMRHEASLAPVALLREWQVDLQVRQKRNAYSLTGKATAYGRGFSLAQARVSCCMEIVERASAYVSITENGRENWVALRKEPLPLVETSFSELMRRGDKALDPSLLGSADHLAELPLNWVEAKDPQGRTVLVPAQAVFLFFNVDEPDYLSVDSTGLASGTSLAQAKLNALLEILERDALATMPFERARCFLAKSRDPRLQALLDDYAARGIRVQFQDMTHEFGLPVLSAFVRSQDGRCVRAQACKLSGLHAALAALSETPWPYSITQPAPYGQATGLGLTGLSESYLEDLPDFSFPDVSQALQFVEARLLSFGLTPLYVDITRADLDFPVVRAILPGLACSEELNSHAVPSQRFQTRVLRTGHLDSACTPLQAKPHRI